MKLLAMYYMICGQTMFTSVLDVDNKLLGTVMGDGEQVIQHYAKKLGVKTFTTQYIKLDEVQGGQCT